MEIEAMAALLLSQTTGLDVEGEHGHDTPKRFVKMLQDCTDRTKEDFSFTTFSNTEGVDEMIIMQNIPFYTFCNHHVVPFFGRAHVAYVPDDLVVGLSKLGRTVKYFAKGLWVQEHLTVEIANFLEDKLQPKGVAVIMEAEHLCMTMRGVEMPGTVTTTSCMRGVFSDHSRTAKAEFLSRIGQAR
jgi:GTP cyclohydrolase I